MYKKLLGIVALAFAFVLSQSALADSSSCGEGLHKMVESLKLDNAQKEKIKPILEQFKTTVKASASQMMDIRKQMDQQMSSPTMDQGAVNGLIDQKSKLIGDIMKAKVSAQTQIRDVLNDQQKTEMSNMVKKAEQKMVDKFKACHEDQ